MLSEAIYFGSQSEKVFFIYFGEAQKSATKNSYQCGSWLDQRPSDEKAPGDGTSGEHGSGCI